MTDTPCVIFAGGKSSRMGEDKSLLPFGGFDTLTQFQLAKASKIFKKVYISCKDSSKFDFEAEFIHDIETTSTYAPTLGIISVFQTIEADSFFALSVDTPLITKEIILKLLDKDSKSKTAQVSVARTKQGLQPMCAIYHRSIYGNLLKMIENDNHKLGYLLKSVKTLHVDFDNEDAFLNINNPHEYEYALKLL